MLIKSIMTSDVRVCAADSTVAAAARVMSNRDCGIVPVVDADGKVGGCRHRS
jgi:predicted transcriptional regulator